MIRVEVDPNIRVRGNYTYAGFEECDTVMKCGDEVEVFEPESGLVGIAYVTEVDDSARLVFLEVNWAEMNWTKLEQSNDGKLASNS